MLSAELYKRGLAHDLIEQVLSEVYQEFPEEELAADLVAKWRRSMNDAITESDVMKLAQSLARKGFDWNNIRRQVDDLTREIR